MATDLLRWRKESRKRGLELWNQLAEMVGTSPGYLDQIAYGYRTASPKRAQQIEKATLRFRGIKPVKKESLLFADSL